MCAAAFCPTGTTIFVNGTTEEMTGLDAVCGAVRVAGGGAGGYIAFGDSMVTASNSDMPIGASEVATFRPPPGATHIASTTTVRVTVGQL